jgi:ABC-type antimicrobial peptide transport system permease subunit
MIKEVGEREVTPTAFVPYPYQPTPNTGIVVRAAGDAAALTPQIRAAIRAADPALPVFAASSMDELRRKGFWQYKLFGQMFGTFGVLALVLAVVGVYGVLSFSVSQRTQEFGVRMALGADRRRILGMVLRQGSTQVVLGVVLGLGLALGLATLGRDAIGNLLIGVSARDPLTFGAVVGLVAFVSLMATLVPARRATQVDPMVALRAE